MWISRHEWEEMKRKVESLETCVRGPASISQRVSDLEQQTQPFRVGEAPAYYNMTLSMYHQYVDPRPKVSMKQAIEMVMEHLKLRFSKTDAVPERVDLEKVK
jgi:hypothetical protein